MKCHVIESFRVKLSGIETELKEGQLITLPHETAIRLLNEGRITPAGRVAYRIYSNILEAFLWVVQDDAGADKLRAEGISEPIYTGHEIENLKDIDKEGLKTVQKIKQIFEKSKIEDIS